jgi:hypothetical protein
MSRKGSRPKKHPAGKTKSLPTPLPAPSASLPVSTVVEAPHYEIDVDAHFASASLTEAQEQVRAQAERRAAARAELPPPPPRVSSGLLASALASWLVVAALLLLRPSVVRGPTDHPWEPSPSVSEASLRYGLWLAQGHVEAFVRTNQRMPSFRAEAGVEDRSITLTIEQGRSYHLDGTQGALQLRLTSTMAADSFLGSSLTQLRSE